MSLSLHCIQSIDWLYQKIFGGLPERGKNSTKVASFGAVNGKIRHPLARNVQLTLNICMREVWLKSYNFPLFVGPLARVVSSCECGEHFVYFRGSKFGPIFLSGDFK